MPSSKLSSRGQIVIPKEVREFLDVRTGDHVDFVMRDTGEVVLRPAVLDVRELRGMLCREGRPAVSVEEMNRAIRERGRRAS